MKKAMLSSLCSAIVIPGLGQVMNGQLRKGVLILAAVFILFIVSLVQLYQIINLLFSGQGVAPPGSTSVLEKTKEMDLTVLWLVLGIFAALWLYSIIDAFFTGRRLEKSSESETP